LIIKLVGGTVFGSDAAHAALALGATAAAFRQAAGGGVEAVAAKKSKKGAGEGGEAVGYETL
jgi:hypothetical protein